MTLTHLYQWDVIQQRTTDILWVRCLKLPYGSVTDLQKRSFLVQQAFG